MDQGEQLVKDADGFMQVEPKQPRSSNGVKVVNSPIRFAGAPRPALRRMPLPGEHAAELLAPHSSLGSSASSDAEATPFVTVSKQ